jgi:TRAP-type mannitol/chloroaromatic compound transport system permease large subunit
LGRVRATIVAVEKQYLERVFVNVSVQHAMRVRHVVIYGLLGSTVFFLTLAHKRQSFLKKKTLLNIECLF